MQRTLSAKDGIIANHTGNRRTFLYVIIAETSGDMKKFENSSKFTGRVGLRPRNDESAGKYKSTAITKGNKHLKSAPVQTAWGATRIKGGYFKDKFTRLAMRKSQKKALIAIARKIGVFIYCVLKEKNPLIRLCFHCMIR